MALSSSHHPQHDGQTEIANRFLETMLRAYMSEDRACWVEWIYLLEFAYNTHISPSTSSSLFQLLLGFQPESPLNRLAKMTRAQEAQAKYYNRGRKEFPELKPGDLVLVNPHSLAWKEGKGKGVKLVQRWIGSFEVIKKVNPKVYHLRMSDRYPGSLVFNIEHLKPYIDSPPELKEHTKLPEMQLEIPSDEFEVEEIVGHKYQRGKIQYLVRWTGYGPQFDSWASTADLKNAPEIVRNYRRSEGL
ncbi:uncharacterized protein ARMOST_20089 [Armillaria ostoyae]|uniref:Chromo domain-containing protein n=1 Tax=Armillaria ostoyae TaxID=47428 RepID=A0A284S6D2_ARMOS|nr:uncharacterized protein ARMOST_20089 [Armillaria ostoyae]